MSLSLQALLERSSSGAEAEMQDMDVVDAPSGGFSSLIERMLNRQMMVWHNQRAS